MACESAAVRNVVAVARDVDGLPKPHVADEVGAGDGDIASKARDILPKSRVAAKPTKLPFMSMFSA